MGSSGLSSGQMASLGIAYQPFVNHVEGDDYQMDQVCNLVAKDQAGNIFDDDLDDFETLKSFYLVSSEAQQQASPLKLRRHFSSNLAQQRELNEQKFSKKKGTLRTLFSKFMESTS